MTKFLIITMMLISQIAMAQKEGKTFKISENQWSEVTHGFKIRDTFKNRDFRYGIDISKEVLTGRIISKRTIYSNDDCSCILLVINFNKGAPYELVDYLFKFKKHYTWDSRKWRFEKQVPRVGYGRCL